MFWIAAAESFLSAYLVVVSGNAGINVYVKNAFDKVKPWHLCMVAAYETVKGTRQGVVVMSETENAETLWVSIGLIYESHKV